MVDVQGLRKSYGDVLILDGVGFQLRPKERVALVGRNGTGKSTLVRAIAGLVEPDAGNIRMPDGWTVAYLPQDGIVGSDRPLYAEMTSVFEDVRGLEARQRDLEAAMVGRDPDDPGLNGLIEEHAALHAEFERRDGYTVDTRMGTVLAGLGFSQADYERRVDQLSGGWQMRAALAKLLLVGADVLLLDEPTNHLDLAAVEWLEEYLTKYRGAVVIVSHDRYLLDRVATRTLEIEDAGLTEYAGNYSWYVQERERRRANEQAEYERQQGYLTQQTAFVERFRGSKRATAAKSREKMLAKLVQVVAPRQARRMVFRLAPCPPSAREVAVLKGVGKSYGDLGVLTGCDLLIEQGERIGLIGPNGAGKSTLLRLLARIERPDRGSITHGEGVRIAYYAQNQAEALDPDKTVLQEVYGASRSGATLGEIRSLLGHLLFTRDDVFKSIAALSGGERSRVALAKMLLRPANLLLLDEPTNHLDGPGREVLEESLSSYEGTIVVASHDRFFLDVVTTKTIEVQDGRLEIFPGNYSYYRQRKLAQASVPQLAPARLPVAGPAAVRRTVSRRGETSSSGVSEREIAAIEREIGEAERRLGGLADLLGRPEAYAAGQSPGDLLAEYESVAKRLDELNRRWEELVEAL